MKYYSVYFVAAVLLFILSTGYHWHEKMAEDTPLSSCISHTELVHGPLRIDAQYRWMMFHGNGVLRVNGIAYFEGKKYPISRQIHFNYHRVGETYTLEASQVEILSTDKGEVVKVETHFPTFFTQQGRRLTVTIQQNKYTNSVISLGNIPVFYCTES